MLGLLLGVHRLQELNGLRDGPVNGQVVLKPTRSALELVVLQTFRRHSLESEGFRVPGRELIMDPFYEGQTKGPGILILVLNVTARALLWHLWVAFTFWLWRTACQELELRAAVSFPVSAVAAVGESEPLPLTSVEGSRF